MITDILLKILIFAYAGVGIANVVAFWPTIKDMMFHKKKSANTDSYILWTILALISFLYSIFILNDWLVRIVTGLNFICCALILILCLRLK